MDLCIHYLPMVFKGRFRPLRELNCVCWQKKTTAIQMRKLRAEPDWIKPAPAPRGERGNNLHGIHTPPRRAGRRFAASTRHAVACGESPLGYISAVAHSRLLCCGLRGIAARIHFLWRKPFTRKTLSRRGARKGRVGGEVLRVFC